MVRSGKLTATEGAQRLGISRKTYYEWEDRALTGMARALENQAPGRPPTPLDPEKEALQREVGDLKEKLLLAEQTIEVKELLRAYDLHEDKKKRTKRQKGGKSR
jgi:transposase